MTPSAVVVPLKRWEKIVCCLRPCFILWFSASLERQVGCSMLLTEQLLGPQQLITFQATLYSALFLTNTAYILSSCLSDYLLNFRKLKLTSFSLKRVHSKLNISALVLNFIQYISGTKISLSVSMFVVLTARCCKICWDNPKPWLSRISTGTLNGPLEFTDNGDSWIASTLKSFVFHIKGVR